MHNYMLSFDLLYSLYGPVVVAKTVIYLYITRFKGSFSPSPNPNPTRIA
jgi:hypothetical protein